MQTHVHTHTYTHTAPAQAVHLVFNKLIHIVEVLKVRIYIKASIILHFKNTWEQITVYLTLTQNQCDKDIT